MSFPFREVLSYGSQRLCPKCHKKGIFSGYLQVRDHCLYCQTSLENLRPDDGPAYLTLLIVSHVAIPALMAFDYHYPYTSTAVFALLSVLICTALGATALPFIKGMVVNALWHIRERKS